MRSIYSASLLLCSTALGLAASVPAKSQTVLPDPAITAYAQAYDANFLPDKVFDNNPATTYASKDKGINTFIDFDFGAATVINGFDMKQRNDIARVLTSNLIFDDNADFASPLTTTVTYIQTSPLPLINTHLQTSPHGTFAGMWPRSTVPLISPMGRLRSRSMVQLNLCPDPRHSFSPLLSPQRRPACGAFVAGVVNAHRQTRFSLDRRVAPPTPHLRPPATAGSEWAGRNGDDLPL